MTMSESETLRGLLGERIPDAGSESDTLFTDVEIDELLEKYSGSARNALAEGWEIKAAALANLVNIQEGTAKRQMSDLYDHALKMADRYSAGSSSRARIGIVTRL